MNQVAHALRLASTFACGVVLIAFGLWATDETKSASGQQAAQVDTPALSQPSAAAAPATAEPEHDGARGAVESVNDTLVGPFEGAAESTNGWVRHGVPALLALLTYGLLARLLIAYMAPGA